LYKNINISYEYNDIIAPLIFHIIIRNNYNRYNVLEMNKDLLELYSKDIRIENINIVINNKKYTSVFECAYYGILVEPLMESSNSKYWNNNLKRTYHNYHNYMIKRNENALELYKYILDNTNFDYMIKVINEKLKSNEEIYDYFFYKELIKHVINKYDDNNDDNNNDNNKAIIDLFYKVNHKYCLCYIKYHRYGYKKHKSYRLTNNYLNGIYDDNAKVELIKYYLENDYKFDDKEKILKIIITKTEDKNKISYLINEYFNLTKDEK